MTVTSNTSRIQYNCNGATSAFAFTFGAGATSEVQVILTSALGVETILTETTHYTVSATNNDYSAGGTVTTVTVYATGNKITILRNVPLTQESDFIEGQPMLYETFETGLDKLTRLTQQQQEELNRAPKLPESSSITEIALPNPTANNYIGWNAGATGLENKATPVITTATAYEVDALISYGGGVNYTQATIQFALTAIGTVNKVTLLVRPGTWVISSNANWSAYTNVTFKIVPGAMLHINTGVFVTIPRLDENITTKIFDCADATGNVLFADGAFYAGKPEWWGAKPDGVTNSTTALYQAGAVCQRIQLSNGTYMTDGWILYGAGRVISGAAGYNNAGIDTMHGTRIKARGTQSYVLATVSRLCEFDHIIFDGNWTTTTVVTINSPSLGNKFKHCTFQGTLDDTGLGGTSNGKLVWDNSILSGIPGTPVTTFQGDSMLFEDCTFSSGDATKISAESIRITGTNAFLIQINRCFFYYARIHISFASGGGGWIRNSEFEDYSYAAIYYTSSGQTVSVENNYTEQTGGIPFFRMSADPAALSTSQIVLRENMIGDGSINLYLAHPITLQNNNVQGYIYLYPPAALTPYSPVLSIRNSLTLGYAGSAATRVIQLGDVGAQEMPLALEVGANRNVYGIELTPNSTTTVVSNTAVKTNSAINLMPRTATAAVAVGSATGVWVSAISNGVSFTITHPDTADVDKTFWYMIVN